MKIVKIKENIFREYDLRGIYPSDIDANVAYTLGKSFGTYIKKMGENKTIIGHDNRISSPELSTFLLHGILDSGIDVINLGLVTTPMYNYGKKKFLCNTGTMVTASHNPKDYNGFKISFSKNGNAYGKMITDFRDFTNAGTFDEGNGKEEKVSIKKEYIQDMKKNIRLGSKKIRVVIDCGNGTGSIVIKDIFDAFEIEYYPLYCESDGTFPNHHPDPCENKNQQELCKKVLELGYDIGIGIDGDADRVGIVLENGETIKADEFMIIMYRYLNKYLKNKKALFDVMCSQALVDELKKLNIEPVMYRIGSPYINMMMQEENFDFGGEYSGHLFFRDRFTGCDDGIYAGLRMIEMLSHTSKPLSSFLDGINKYYSTEEIKVDVTDSNKFDIVSKVKEYCDKKNYSYIDIDGIRVEFEDGWALVRASNTCPNLTLRFEAITEDRLQSIQNEFMELIDTLK